MVGGGGVMGLGRFDVIGPVVIPGWRSGSAAPGRSQGGFLYRGMNLPPLGGRRSIEYELSGG